MKAVSIQDFGGPDMLRVTDHPVPHEGEVIVRVMAAGVNAIDTRHRAGTSFLKERIQARLPWIPGYEFAGVVVAVQDQVTRFRPLDAVMGITRFPETAGAYAEYVAVPESCLAHKPERLDFREASAVPLGALSAWQALDAGDLKGPERLLVLGGAGNVGQFITQFACARGARVMVTGKAFSESQLERLGAIAVIDPDRLQEVRRFGLPDLVIDLTGGDAAREALDMLSPGTGRMVTMPIRSAKLRLAEGMTAGKAVYHVRTQPDGQMLDRIGTMIDDHAIRVALEASFRPEHAAQAHSRLESGYFWGRTVLDFE